MAYLLEFPPRTLPSDIRAPPYVIFGINGKSVTDILPPRIPLNMVLHFAPKLAQCVLPAPDNLPPAVTKGVLRTPYIGIDIRLDIGPASLQRIIFKMMQAAGHAVPKNLFLHAPSLITCISIRKTWLLFELPSAGLDGLLIHMQTRLMTGPPVTFTELHELFAHFPADHMVLRLAATNFVQAHIELYYNRDEFSSIRHWYLSSKERFAVFKVVEDQFPEFGKQKFPLRGQGHVNIGDVESAKKVREQVRKGTRAESAEDLKKRMRSASAGDIKKSAGPTVTVRKSTGRPKSLGGSAEAVEMGIMSSLLDDALRKVQEARDEEDKRAEEEDKKAEEKQGQESEDKEQLESKMGSMKMEG